MYVKRWSNIEALKIVSKNRLNVFFSVYLFFGSWAGVRLYPSTSALLCPSKPDRLCPSNPHSTVEKRRQDIVEKPAMNLVRFHFAM